MHHLDDESVHLILTSPPYWTAKNYGNQAQIGFNESIDIYTTRMAKVWHECVRVLKPGCRMVINIGDQFVRATDEQPYHIAPLHSYVIESVLQNKEMIFLGNIIWRKITNTKTSGGASVMGSYGRPRNGYLSLDYEYIMIFKKLGKDPIVPKNIVNENRIGLAEWRKLFAGHWEFPGEKQKLHSAPFPEELPQRIIKMFSFPNDVVLDPFLGSGTTMKVAKTMNRECVGYEIGFDSPTGKNWKEVVRNYVGNDVEFVS